MAAKCEVKFCNNNAVTCVKEYDMVVCNGCYKIIQVADNKGMLGAIKYTFLKAVKHTFFKEDEY